MNCSCLVSSDAAVLSSGEWYEYKTRLNADASRRGNDQNRNLAFPVFPPRMQFSLLPSWKSRRQLFKLLYGFITIDFNTLSALPCYVLPILNMSIFELFIFRLLILSNSIRVSRWAPFLWYSIHIKNNFAWGLTFRIASDDNKKAVPCDLWISGWSFTMLEIFVFYCRAREKWIKPTWIIKRSYLKNQTMFHGPFIYRKYSFFHFESSRGLISWFWIRVFSILPQFFIPSPQNPIFYKTKFYQIFHFSPPAFYYPQKLNCWSRKIIHVV